MKISPVFIVPLLLVSLALSCGGGSDKPANEDEDVAVDVAGGAIVSRSDLFGVGEFSSVQQADGAVPGVTVSGSGTATAQPDGALILVTIGSGDTFSGFPRFEVIDEDEIEPVIEFLSDRGVSKDDMKVNLFATSTFSSYGGGAAQINFRWTDLDGLSEFVRDLDEAIRDETEYSVDNLAILFTVEECEPLEEEAWTEAIGDATARAGKLAELADVSLGSVISISEATVVSLYGNPIASAGCANLEQLATTNSLDIYTVALAASSSEVVIQETLNVTFEIE